MTEQEIEKLRDKLGSDYSVKRQNGAITVELVDIWKGVEYAKGLYSGSIYKIVHNHAWNISIQTDSGTDIGSKDNYTPSTESAYVEQLKAKAKALYGEIKDGDRFCIDENLGEVSMYDCEDGFIYWKEEDLLYFGNYAIYSKGKWAKKVEEPIRVNVSSIRYSREPIEYMGELIPSETIDCTVHFTIEGSSPKIILKEDFRQLLSKCLEDYLNKS